MSNMSLTTSYTVETIHHNVNVNNGNNTIDNENVLHTCKGAGKMIITVCVHGKKDHMFQQEHDVIISIGDNGFIADFVSQMIFWQFLCCFEVNFGL